mmetsp:Transcript_38804/g.76934  ORF Transcript_38804/g.76934 Transcript_38804/m.76934 type:complete len:306 (+) Transcript_38804:548-1465(+)
MASDIAICAAFESSMALEFNAFSEVRIAVALATAASRALSSAVVAAISSPRFAIEALRLSISACRVSMASVFAFRVSLLVASSESHQPFFLASLFASAIRRAKVFEIILLTFLKGSLDIRFASCRSSELPKYRAFSRRKRSTVVSWVLSNLPRNCTSAPISGSSSIDCKCLSELPDTVSLETISIALLMALISSIRSCCRDLKLSSFSLHVATTFLRYFLSAMRVFVTSTKLPLAVAKALILSVLIAILSDRSAVARLVWSFKSWIRSLKVCFAFTSSLWSTILSWTNLSKSASSNLMRPSDWNA